ncbi:DJ-1/PfpI family protein [Rhizobium lusitanum]|uniref:Cyclohexyl-isocyanide hydratase n=1 Tax=Rhizobium lusitanum TaxID=293958 RepID=A0A7X0MEB5_9HYPH|nr:DJ-1/PfpI family protein [Rhizobium lusitanum]MBB6485860.1 cyclohexyl-isocyanide hydratase [Rhizobium lusitanum]
MTLHIGLLAFPGVQQLDLTAPYEVFASAQGTKVHLVWKAVEPLISATGLELKSTVSFADCPKLDVLCVPGGSGINALLRDKVVLDFIRQQARTARFITSVCTGSLVLGAAGLLKGKRAATHWNAIDFLPRFGATAVDERVVRDGNLITAGGVTSGIDFALTVIAELFGENEARTVQLSLEYAPAPPFEAGLPKQVTPDIVAAAQQRMAASRAQRERILADL